MAKTIKERKQNWCDLYEGRINRVYQVVFPGDNEKRPMLWPDKTGERIDFIIEKYEKQMERMEWLDDDHVPFLDMISGTEIFAEAFGAEVHRVEGEMPFAKPFLQNAQESSKLKVPELYSSTLAYQFELADRVREKAGDDAVFGMVDIQSPIDIVSLLWNKEDLMVSFIENPEAVKELCEKVRILLYRFLDEWFSRYGKEFIAHFPDYYMPYGVTVSEDEVGTMSAHMYKDLFLEQLCGMGEYYKRIGIHCCANAKHQWGNFSKVKNLAMINVCQPEAVLRESVNFFTPYCAQIPGNGVEVLGEEWQSRDFYPDNARVVVRGVANTKDEALKLLEKWK